MLKCPCCGGQTSVKTNEPACRICDLHPSPDGRLWLSKQDSTPSGFDSASAERLTDLVAQNHFWTRERTHLTAKLLDRMAATRRSTWTSAIELGCGSGNMLDLLEQRVPTVTAMDGHRSLLNQARQVTKRSTLVQGDVTRTGLAPSQFDLLLSMDVIEHVDPDALLSEARRIAKPGADLLISVPAFPSLWSNMDQRAGHRCRYRWRQMKNELEHNGWQPSGHTHFQFFLFPLVYASRQWAGSASHTTERRPSKILDRCLGAINHLEVRWLNSLPLPFGSSLFVWAKAANP